MKVTLALLMFFALLRGSAIAQPSPSQLSSRMMDDLNWKEFGVLVPGKLKTLILAVGTLELHVFINNAADNTVPQSIATTIAPDINALIAPHIPYGITDILAPYPGSLYIPPDAFRVYLRAVLVGLVNNKFRNIV